MLNLGRDLWVGFDTDLLRVAAMWQGTGVYAESARARLVSRAGPQDARAGSRRRPSRAGTVWLANGIYPGWQAGAPVARDDPREPAPIVEEVGRGPLPNAMGRFKAVRLVRDGAVLEYTVRRRGRARVDDRRRRPIGRPAASSIVRHIHVGPATEPLWLDGRSEDEGRRVSLGTRTGVPIGWTRSGSNRCDPRCGARPVGSGR